MQPPATAEPTRPARERGQGTARWLPRRWRRLVVLLVLAGAAVHLLLPQVGQLDASLRALRTARPGWLLLAVVLVTLTFPASAVSVSGAAGTRLPLWPTTQMELAASFLNRLTPGGLGRAGLLSRYLDRAGTPRVAIAGVVAVNLAAGAVVHVGALLLAAGLTRPSMIRHQPLPDRWTDLLAVLTVLVGSGIAVAAVLLRRRWDALRDRLHPLRRQLRAVFTRPRFLLALVGGVAAVNALMIVSLQTCLAGFGARPAFAIVAVVYLGGSTIAAVAPTPGGLGVMEAALVAGLTGLGVATGPAVTGVLAFRLASWWLPAGVGAISWASLHRRDLL